MNAPTTNTDLRKFAKKGIDLADDTTLKLIIDLLKEQKSKVEEKTAYEKEMLRRIDDYEQGRIKPISLEYLENSARENHKKRIQSQK